MLFKISIGAGVIWNVEAIRVEDAIAVVRQSGRTNADLSVVEPVNTTSALLVDEDLINLQAYFAANVDASSRVNQLVSSNSFSIIMPE